MKRVLTVKSITRSGWVQTAEALLVIVAVCDLETIFVAEWLNHNIGLDHLLVLHGLLVCMLGVWLYLRRRRKAELRFAGPLVVLTAALGPIGAWGALLIAVCYALFRIRAQNFADWYRSLMPERPRMASVQLYDQLISGAMDAGRDQSVASFIDVLVHGTDEQRLALIAMAAENFRPAFAPVLRQALQSRDPAVRVLAATAVTRINTAAHEKSERLNAILRKSPDDAATMRELGLHLKSQADIGLVAEDRASAYRIEALSKLVKYLESDDDDSKVIAAVGNLAVRLGKHAYAKDWLERHDAVRVSDPEAFSDYLEALYNLRRFAELRASVLAAGSLGLADSLPSQMRGVIALWRAPGDVVVAGAA